MLFVASALLTLCHTTGRLFCTESVALWRVQVVARSTSEGWSSAVQALCATACTSVLWLSAAVGPVLLNLDRVVTHGSLHHLGQYEPQKGERVV